MENIPSNHPRATSLYNRHKLIDGMHKKIVAEAGLIAHGRGEAYDYLIGEKTHDFAIEAITAAAVTLLQANFPVISVNGNTAVLCPEALISLSKSTDIPLEVNLFYRSEERISAIREHFHSLGFDDLLGVDPKYYDSIEQLSSARRIVDTRGIHKADVILVPLEDGDRTEYLRKQGRTVISIDLNPLSRTSKMSDITIVDNVIRAIPLIKEKINEIKKSKILTDVSKNYSNSNILTRALQAITAGMV